MALKYLTDLNLLKNELQNAVVHPLATAPSNPVEGQFYVNTTDHKFYVYLNGAWSTFMDATAVTEALSAKAADSTVVHNTGDETVAGTKTFSSSPVVPTAALNDSSTKAASTAFVGNEIADYTYNKATIQSMIDAKDSLPSQTGHNGEYLTTDGSAASWAPITQIRDDNTKSVMLKLWVGTKQQYDAITTKDEHTIYYIQKDGQAIDIYELLEAKQDKLNAGNNITLTPEEDGTVTIDATYSYTLPTASDSVLGGVKVGTNLTIDSNGVLSATVPVTSVAGKTGAVTLDKSDVGLGNVDNTSDANKPISTATQAALDLKADAATTLAGYGITDAYTKSEVDAKVSSVYKFKGSVATVADLPSTGNTEGDVYNVIATGDNYAWVDASESEESGAEGYWDKLGGDIDLSGYLTKTEAASTYATHEEVEQIAQGSVHKVTYTNGALTPTAGVATWEVSHSLGADVQAIVKEVATGDEVMADITYGTNIVTVKMNAADTIAADTYKIVILG